MAMIIDEVKDCDNNGFINIADIKHFLQTNPSSRISLTNGSFDSKESIEFLQRADIVVTNPPFSKFRSFLAQLVDHKKYFLILGHQNALTYREIFPLIRDNRLWLGHDNGGTKWFRVRADYNIATKSRIKMIGSEKFFSMGSIVWFTNLDHGRRHEYLQLMSTRDNLRYSPVMRGRQSYQKYDNYDAIEVSTYRDIPNDFDGVMGVPITFLSKYNPEQFEIIGLSASAGYNSDIVGVPLKPGFRDARPIIDGQVKYARVFIRHR